MEGQTLTGLTVLTLENQITRKDPTVRGFSCEIKPFQWAETLYSINHTGPWNPELAMWTSKGIWEMKTPKLGRFKGMDGVVHEYLLSGGKRECVIRGRASANLFYLKMFYSSFM